MWIDNMFGVKKPIITMLHLDPLPGVKATANIPPR